MKTSKIILITLLGTIALTILAATIDWRLRGHKTGEPFNNKEIKKQFLPPFNVLYLNDIRNVAIVQSDSCAIAVGMLDNSTAPEINYKIKGDTLIINSFDKVVGTQTFVSVYMANPLKQIDLINSDIRIPKYNSDNLLLSLDRSSVIFNNRINSPAKIKILNILAKNKSVILTNTLEVDKLNITLQNSEVTIRGNIVMISADLSEGSRLTAKQPGELSVKRDLSSKISIFAN
jgi:hypothetical protein